LPNAAGVVVKREPLEGQIEKGELKRNRIDRREK